MFSFRWGAIFGLVSILVIGAVIFIATVDWNRAKPYLSTAVSKATGRQLSIEGDLEVNWGWISRLRAEQIRFENASWSKHPKMVELGLVDVEVDLWRLVKEWRAVVPTITISQLEVTLEKNAEGAANWEFRAAPVVTDPVVPESRGEFPVTGESFRDLMATASGNTFLVMSGGELSGLLVELAGLDVAEALTSLVRGDKSVPVRCAALDFNGKDGQMGVQTLVFDTEDTIIFGEGKIDLRDEQVDIVLTPVPKDFSPFSLRSFVRVSGGFTNVSAFPDPLKTGTKSLLAKIFNVFVLVATSVVQPRDLWFGRDFNCDALLASLKDHDPQGVVLKDHYKNSKKVKTKLPLGRREPAQQKANVAR